jgi:hypothetical protein
VLSERRQLALSEKRQLVLNEKRRLGLRKRQLEQHSNKLLQKHPIVGKMINFFRISLLSMLEIVPGLVNNFQKTKNLK